MNSSEIWHLFLSFPFCAQIPGFSPNTKKINTGQLCKLLCLFSSNLTSLTGLHISTFRTSSKHIFLCLLLLFLGTTLGSTDTSPPQIVSVYWLNQKAQCRANHRCVESRAESTAARAWTVSTYWTPTWVKDCTERNNLSVCGCLCVWVCVLHLIEHIFWMSLFKDVFTTLSIYKVTKHGYKHALRVNVIRLSFFFLLN